MKQPWTLIHSGYRVCIVPYCILATLFQCAVMDTRSQLLESDLPRPEMSTSPSGLTQGAHVRESHPQSVKQFDIIPDVLEYISSLGPTHQRFKPIDFGYQPVRSLYALCSIALRRHMLFSNGFALLRFYMLCSQ